MRLLQLSLTQFRSYESLALQLSGGVNAFAGPNGVGKTNLLEAAHLLATGRGFGSVPERDLAHHNAPFFMVEGTGCVEGQAELASPAVPPNPLRVACNWQQGKGKRLLVDGQPVARASQHLGRIPVVALLPDDTDLVRGAPELRRQWLDMLLSQSDPGYLAALIQYEKALAQRNAQLRAFANGQAAFDAALLELWEPALQTEGTAIWRCRKAFLAAYIPLFRHFHAALLAEDAWAEPARLEYDSNLAEASGTEWQAAFRNNLRRDVALARTHAGPHRDDLKFLLSENALRAFGSQGQRKTFVAALKLAQAAYLEQQTGKPPILLLDDLFDKLDSRRAARLAQTVCQQLRGQVLATDSSEERLRAAFAGSARAFCLFRVPGGGVVEQAPAGR